MRRKSVHRTIARRQMDDGARKWLIKTARKNLWRVADYYDLDDLIQDGLIVWARVVKKYPRAKDKPHLMALFMRSYTNHINTLSKSRTRERDAVKAMIDTSLIIEPITDDGFGHLAAKIATAPPAIQNLLRALATEHGSKVLNAVYRQRRDGSRETRQERLCRMAMVPNGTDLAALARSYFLS